MSRTNLPPFAVSDTRLNFIEVKGFKSTHQKIRVDFAPLTLLAGQNSAGKSTAIQPLLLMKQTLEATHDPGVLEINGSCVKFNESAQLLWHGRSKSDAARTWEITLGLHRREVSITYFRKQNGGFSVRTTSIRSYKKDNQQSDVSIRTKMSLDDLRTAAQISGFPHEIMERSGVKFQWTVHQDRCAHRLEGRFRDLDSPPVFTIGPLPTELLESIIYLPGLRGHPERAYPVTRSTDRYPGPFQHYTASVLLGWAESKSKKLAEVSSDINRLGLTWKVIPKRIDDTHVEIRVGRLPRPQQGGANDTVNIADVGFGASQVLPVLVALRVAARDQIVHIEQPELHLHPNAQARMAELLLDTAKRGVRLIVETHSSIILKKIQSEIASTNNDIKPSDVALHWFSRDPCDGSTRVETAEVGVDGSYGDWPVDFADVEMAVEQEYIEHAVQRMREEDA